MGILWAHMGAIAGVYRVKGNKHVNLEKVANCQCL